VLIQDGHGIQHRITWSNRAKTPLTDANPGKFVYRWPDKLEYPTITVGRGSTKRTFPDTLSPKRRVPGEKQEWESHSQFWEWLEKRVGPLAEEIRNAFAGRIVEVMASARKRPALQSVTTSMYDPLD
jgi:hypothetical protein